VVGCRRQGGKGHRHICLALSLSLSSLCPLLLQLPAVPLLMCGAFAFYLGRLSLSLCLAHCGLRLCSCCVRTAGDEGGAAGWMDAGLAPYRRRAQKKEKCGRCCGP
jgi:hypothetical protein